MIPGGVNSPVRAFRSVGGTPPFIARGDGPVITDVDGNAYIDYVCSWGPLLLGHRHPAILDALRAVLDVGTSFGAPTEREIRLAELIQAAMPSMEMVRLVNSGTEATMSALRVARGFTGRELAIKFEGCYHGHVDSLLVKAGSGVATLGLPDTAGVPRAFADTTIALPYNSIEALEAAFSAHGDRIASVIVEPVAGNMGCIPPAPGFLEAMRRLCTEHGALLIFDEVMTGFRVAHGGAQQLYGIRPDLHDDRQGDRRRASDRGLRRSHRYYEPRRACGSDLPGGDVERKSTGGGGGDRGARALGRPPGGVCGNRGADRCVVRGAARGSDGEPGGLDVHVLLHGSAGDGLRVGQAERHEEIRALLPPYAGEWRVPGAVAVRGGIRVSGAFGGGHRKDRGGGSGVPG